MAIVHQASELIITAAWFSMVGMALVVIASVVDGNAVAVIAVAFLSALAIGVMLHVIERSRRLTTLASAPALPNDGEVERWYRTAFRQGTLVLVSATVAVVVLSLGWNGIRFMPGIFFGAALWLWLDARLLRTWEADHHAEVFRRADWGFAWLRRGSDGRYVMRGS
jgi:hypothetical protein